MDGEFDEDGMTDLQFKSYLKQLIGRLKAARNECEPDRMRDKLDEIVCDLTDDITG